MIFFSYIVLSLVCVLALRKQWFLFSIKIVSALLLYLHLSNGNIIEITVNAVQTVILGCVQVNLLQTVSDKIRKK